VSEAVPPPEQPLPEPVRVLHVCTGNICRSPMAERIMAAELAAAFPGPPGVADLRGAGTYGGHEGQPMHGPAAQVLGERGVDGSSFRATWLREPQVEWAELVLTATAEHRGQVLRLDPRALRRTFALRELARLAEFVTPSDLPVGPPSTRLRGLVSVAGGLRAVHQPANRTVDDIDDPFGERVEVFRETADEITTAVRAIIRPLLAAP
jgi:protein-tyrosine phosphatase